MLNKEAFMQPDRIGNRAALLAVVLALAPAAPALAQGAAGATKPAATEPAKPAALDLTKPAATEAANISTVGDYFKFNVDVGSFKQSDADDAKPVTAPLGSCFRVSQELPDPKDPKKLMLRGRFESGNFPRGIWPPYGCEDLHFNTNLSYDVPKQLVMEDRDRNRYGWTYGLLVAPVKYYVKPREFSAGASVGPYLGYRLHDRQGSSDVVALSVGAATASVTTNNSDGSTSSSNTTGLTVAFAYIAEIKGTFNVGLLAGTDLYSKSQNVATSNKLWLGLSFGYMVQ